MPATAKADHVAADRLWKKHCRADEATEEYAAWLQSYHSLLHDSFALKAFLCTVRMPSF